MKKVFFTVSVSGITSAVKADFVRACRQACAAHAASTLPWLNAVGWDAMITDDGPVFFEGNFGIPRTSRRIFLDTPNTMEFLQGWPRDENLR